MNIGNRNFLNLLSIYNEFINYNYNYDSGKTNLLPNCFGPDLEIYIVMAIFFLQTIFITDIVKLINLVCRHG